MKILIANYGESAGEVKIFEYHDKKKELVKEDIVFAHSSKEFKIEAHQRLTVEPK